MLPFSEDLWVHDMRKMYRGVKHANQSLPEPLELYKVYLRGVQVFRVWVARRLGVSAEFLRNRVQYDRLTRSTG